MRSSGERTHVYLSIYLYIYIYIYRDSASVESTRGGSLTLAPIIPYGEILAGDSLFFPQDWPAEAEEGGHDFLIT